MIHVFLFYVETEFHLLLSCYTITTGQGLGLRCLVYYQYMDVHTSAIQCLNRLQEAAVSAPEDIAQRLNAQMGRLHVWIAENKVDRPESKSWKTRFEGASHVISAIIDLFGSLQHLVDHFLTITTLAGPESRRSREGLVKPVTEDELGESSDADSILDGLERSLEPGYMVDLIEETVTSLHQLCSTSMKFAHIDMLSDPLFHDMDLLEETYDVAHVEAKFPGASLPLVTRLGILNKKRRTYLWYKRKKAGPFTSSEVPTKQPDQKARTMASAYAVLTNAGSSTNPSSGPAAMSIFDVEENLPLASDDFGSVSSVPEAKPPENIKEKEPHISVMSEQGSSVDTETSYAVTMTPGRASRARIPQPPSEFYEGKPFECMYCFQTLKTISTGRAWKYVISMPEKH